MLLQAVTQQGWLSLQALQKLAPRQVFEELFAVKACTSLARAAAEAAQADDNQVLLSGVREVDSLTQTALSQPSLGKHQLARLCQVSMYLET